MSTNLFRSPIGTASDDPEHVYYICIIRVQGVPIDSVWYLFKPCSPYKAAPYTSVCGMFTESIACNYNNNFRFAII